MAPHSYAPSETSWVWACTFIVCPCVLPQPFLDLGVMVFRHETMFHWTFMAEGGDCHIHEHMCVSLIPHPSCQHITSDPPTPACKVCMPMRDPARPSHFAPHHRAPRRLQHHPRTPLTHQAAQPTHTQFCVWYVQRFNRACFCKV